MRFETRLTKIVIIDAKLAKQVQAFKSAKKAAVVAAFGVGGIAAANAWNPLGWGTAAAGLGLVGAASLTTGGAAIIAFAVFGTLGLIMYMDYELETSANVDIDPLESGKKINGGGSLKLKKKVE